MTNTTAMLAAYLAEYRLDRPGHDDNPVFFNQHGTKLSRGGIASASLPDSGYRTQ